MCMLESISYTRKDGQYLRWDQRSGRGLGKKVFDKGKSTLRRGDRGEVDVKSPMTLANYQPRMRFDRRDDRTVGRIELLRGTCLEILPTWKPSV